MTNAIEACRASAQCVAAIGRAAGSAQIGPTSLDLPSWIQAIGSIVAIVAVALVAWVEHRRAVRAEKVAVSRISEAEVSAIRALLDIAGHAIETKARFNRSISADVGEKNAAFALLGSPEVQASQDRLTSALERLLGGQSLSVPVLLLGSELIDTLKIGNIPPTPSWAQNVARGVTMTPDEMLQHRFSWTRIQDQLTVQLRDLITLEMLIERRFQIWASEHLGRNFSELSEKERRQKLESRYSQVIKVPLDAPRGAAKFSPP